MSEWVDIKEREPDYNVLVLILCDGEDICVGRMSDSYGECWEIGNNVISWDHDFNYGVGVTHWMPLPKLPKEGKE